MGLKNLLIIGIFLWAWGALISSPAQALGPYKQSLCDSGQYQCIKIQAGETWEKLWPDVNQRQVVQRLNRINTKLQKDSTIAVPINFESLQISDIAQLPAQIYPPGQETVIVDLKKLAWGAYDSEGKLLHWGPASGGKSWCPDVGRACHTRTGEYAFYRKGGADCKSGKFPLPQGGAPMPYCMFYSGGYAIHGSNQVPGYNASHGCVRTFTEDAKWLNENFASGTRVVLYPY